MRSPRREASVAVDLATRLLGRRAVVRAARFVLNRARLDGPNGMHTNGEPELQSWALALAPVTGPVRVVDVGANVGEWSTALLASAARHGRLADVELHACEPSAHTAQVLADALAGTTAKVHRVALSDRTGTATLRVVAPGAGTNSLHGTTGSREEVPTVRLDDLARTEGMTRVDLLKIDTEGHDLAVLRGATELLREHRITVAQFEYNHRWIYGRAYLRDAFELLSPLGYVIGKLTRRGVEFYPGWDPDLESFVEGNYVTCTSRTANRLPGVTWWKSPGRREPATAVDHDKVGI